MWWFFAISIIPINVLIVDTGLSPKNVEMLPYVTQYETTSSDHGPAITGLILSDQGDDWLCPRVKVDVCNFGPGGKTQDKYIQCLSWIKNKHYDYVNLSLSGWSPNKEEETALREISKNSVIVVAAGNDHKHIKDVFPASYLYKGWGNYVVVTNLPSKSSNYGEETMNLPSQNIIVKDMNNNNIVMSGTSLSAARYTHKLLKTRCAYGW